MQKPHCDVSHEKNRYSPPKEASLGMNDVQKTDEKRGHEVKEIV